MKRVLITTLGLAGTLLLMAGADFKSSGSSEIGVSKKHCIGYIIIEAGKGVDCNGDTLKLVKKGGYYGREITAN
ncbi:MAG TPA: hypothetical protein VKZ68_07785 [Ohtaekwangia sp.]|nr:hypothetical protein [Ohtaekwangia sp.]